MANSNSHIIPPQGGGFGAMKVGVESVNIDTYAAGGYTVSLPSGNFKVLGISAENSKFILGFTQVNGVIKITAHEPIATSTYVAGEGEADPTVTTAITYAEVAVATNVGKCLVFYAGA